MSLEANVLLCPAGERPIVAHMFGASIRGTRELLVALASDDPGPAELYDNLDQGWALRVLLRGDAVYWHEWDWESPGGLRNARTLRLCRTIAAAQARAALQRLDRLHPLLVAAAGVDLWAQPGRRDRPASAWS
jgi:hypothetical protein